MKKGVLVLLLLMICYTGMGQRMEAFGNWPMGFVGIDTSFDNPYTGISGEFDADAPKYVSVRAAKGSEYNWNGLFRIRMLNDAESRVVLFIDNVRSGGPIEMTNSRLGSMDITSCRFSYFGFIHDSLSYTTISQLTTNEFSVAESKIAEAEISNSGLGDVSLENLSCKSLSLIPAFNDNDSVLGYTAFTNFNSANCEYGAVTFSLTKDSIVKRVQFAGDRFAEFMKMDAVHAGSILLTNCRIAMLELKNIISDSLDVSGSYMEKASIISGTVKGKVDLSRIEIGSGAELDIRYIRPDTTGGRRSRILIDLYNTPIDKLHLNWGDYVIDWSIDSSSETKMSTYQALLENFKRRGQTESYNLLDREVQRFRYRHLRFQKLGYLWDWLVFLWWDYGHGGWQVVIWTLLLPFIIAFITRYRTVLRMHKYVYAVDNLQEILNRPHGNKWWKKYFRKLSYISVVFFALSVKFEKLHYRKGGLIGRFVAIYLIGIFCLFFIANYLLKA